MKTSKFNSPHRGGRGSSGYTKEASLICSYNLLQRNNLAKHTLPTWHHSFSVETHLGPTHVSPIQTAFSTHTTVEPNPLPLHPTLASMEHSSTQNHFQPNNQMNPKTFSKDQK